MAAMTSMITNFYDSVYYKTYYHWRHCSHFIAATFDFKTLFTQAFEGCTLPCSLDVCMAFLCKLKHCRECCMGIIALKECYISSQDHSLNAIFPYSTHASTLTTIENR